MWKVRHCYAYANGALREGAPLLCQVVRVISLNRSRIPSYSSHILSRSHLTPLTPATPRPGAHLRRPPSATARPGALLPDSRRRPPRASSSPTGVHSYPPTSASARRPCVARPTPRRPPSAALLPKTGASRPPQYHQPSTLPQQTLGDSPQCPTPPPPPHALVY